MTVIFFLRVRSLDFDATQNLSTSLSTSTSLSASLAVFLLFDGIAYINIGIIAR